MVTERFLMEFKSLDFSQNSFLSHFADLVYLMKNSREELEYKTITNGVIGLGIILEGDAFIKTDKTWSKIPRFSIFGMSDKSYGIKLSKNYKEISIGFKPYYFNLFVEEHLNEFTKGKIVNAQDVFGKHELFGLFDKIKYENSEHEIINNFSTFFQARFLAKKENQRVLFATKMVYKNEVNKVEEIAERLNVSSTTIRSLFKHHIGVTPKELMKITRTHKALQFQKQHLETLTELGLELGYFDQSHFIKEFKSLVGVSPNQYFKNRKLAFDFYNYGRWLSDNFVSENQNS